MSERVEFPDPPEIDLPVAYHIPFEWGNFEVTESADEAYRLLTLQPGARQEGYAIEDDKLISVRLLAPSEFPEVFSEADNQFGTQFYVDTGSDHIALDLALTRNRTEAVEQLKDGMQNFLGMDEEDLAEFVTDEKDMPVTPELLDQKVTNYMAHLMSDAAADTVRDVYSEWLRAGNARRVQEHMTRTGLISFAGAAAVVGIAGVNIASDMAAGASVGVGMWAMRDIFKTYVRTFAAREKKISTAGGKIAGKIRRDIHSMYCLDHFDAQAEEMLDAGDESES
ncbi:MAG TPA: hypothetical protein VHB72_02055 [Candidatus Saccharimonadales bacterium]|nr:hypothetical protein [Candidatus Saccharimonadales bacterium]